MTPLRPRYSPPGYHRPVVVAKRYVCPCGASWRVSDVTDALATEGVGSGAYATRVCSQGVA